MVPSRLGGKVGAEGMCRAARAKGGPQITAPTSIPLQFLRTLESHPDVAYTIIQLKSLDLHINITT